MTSTPTLNGQDIGQAESAVRAVLNRLLARTCTPFHGWVILNLLGRGGGALGEDELAGQVAHGLKIGEDAVRAASRLRRNFRNSRISKNGWRGDMPATCGISTTRGGNLPLP